YIYTDRPIYRPGETVYFRGVLRDRNDMDYQIPNIRTVPVTITAADGTQLYQAELPVTEFGTFSGELEIPEDAAIGEAYIQLPNSSVYFTIAEFRVPEFEVNVTAQQDEIRQGESLNAVVEADYYFGGGVSNAEVYWSAYGNPASFNYTGPGHYNFSDATLSRFYSHYIGDGTATTDGDGNFVINIENTAAPAPIPMNITVEATVTDESMQAISGRTTVMAHPANAYVGIRSDRYFGREGQPLNLEMIAVDRDSQPLADKRIELTMVEIRWTREPIDGQFGRYNWTQEEIDVETVELRTSENGTVTYEFTPPNAGIFRARAVVLDEFERPNSSTLRFWVTGSRPVWWGQPSDRIDLIADKDSYQVGDTAEILVPIPFAGGSTVMVTTERAGVISYEVIEVEGSTLLYELPIVETHVPTVYVSVALVKGIDEESLNPEYRTGTIALSVEPVAERLNVKITPSAELTQPGDVLTFDIEVTNAAGEPVQTEIGLALTDKAILALAPPNTGSLENNFYGHQVNYVITRVSIEALLDRITDETVGTENERDEARGVGGGEAAEEGDFAADAEVAAAPTAAPGAEGRQAGPDAVPVREDFQQTPLWEGHVVTDQDGFATVSVELPDNLTTWKLDARGVTLQTQVGQSTTEVVTTLPLLVRPVTPRFLVVGDRVQLASVINNNTPDEQTVEATLRYEGVDLESPATQEVTIPAGGRARVEWTAVAQDVEGVDLTFIAVGADGYQDASKPPLATGPDDTIPVYRYTAPDRVGTGGLLREGGARVEGISLPPRLDTSQGELVIRADPSLAVTTIDSMDYLINYPHQCIEQTVSRFLPNVVTYRALRDLDISDPELEANLFSVLDEALDRLEREQNPDGGWGWFSGMDSNALVTAYAALGLIHARDAGFDVDPAMLERALNFVRSDYITPTIDSSRWRLNRQAFYFYVLAHDGRGSEREFDALYDLRLNMTLTGRAYLLMAYHKLYPNSGAIDDLASDLNTAAILSATGAHWEEDWHDWWNWTSDTRTTALALNALTLVQPDNELLPQAVRWLMVARNGDHWETTQETAWSIIALTDWMVSTGELQGNYNYSVNLNRDTLAEKDVTPETVRDGEVLRIAVSELLTDEINRLIFAREDGTGVLYYTAHLNLRLPASEVDALNRGVMIKRQYFLDGDPENPITSAEVGETITVRLTITLPQDIYYFVLEDPIPAGTEPLDTSLLTTSRQVEGPTLRPGNDREWFWYWGWWWFDRTEMRDEQVNLYADFLPRGTYTYTYQVRASVPGEFQTMPTEAYAFYFPEVFG
ncbi:MAG: alpha-2-macroglobulin, partial [Chloroflexi bacterium]|nr:alpha-2-macroglobulin [Chloroflexota bacterium]